MAATRKCKLKVLPRMKYNNIVQCIPGIIKITSDPDDISDLLLAQPCQTESTDLSSEQQSDPELKLIINYVK